MSSIKFISRATAALVFLLALGAFALSYVSLAAANGLGGWQSYVWPLMLDAALVICSLAVLRANLQGERAVYPWSLVILFSVGTLVFNVLHAQEYKLPPAMVAAVAPVALFLSFELLVGMLRSEIRRHNAMQALADIVRRTTDLNTAQAALQAALGDLETKRSELQEEIKALRKEKQGLSFEITQETLDRAKSILAERSEITGSELGRVLGKSDRLGRQLKHILQVNGNGVAK
jgi:hypothetical protein